MAFQFDYQPYQCYQWKGGVDETGGDDVKKRDESDSVAKRGKDRGEGGMREKVEDGTGNNRT